MKNYNSLFEISWEVCNKVGGIHTVISSKIPQIKSKFKNYYTIGPYLDGNKDEFIPESIPSQFENAAQELEKIGIKIYFGEWKIQNRAKTILIDSKNFSHNINQIKTLLWDKYKIDSLNSDWYDFDEVILWSWCCGIVCEKIGNILGENTIVHSHEWMSGGAIFYLKNYINSNFKTVFTTHATMLGRTICGVGEDLYKLLGNIDPNKKAYELSIHTKHQTEVALAHNSDCFTTVSQITANETREFYKKDADVILYNGFDNFDFEFLHNLDLVYKMSNDRLKDFTYNYFRPFYEIDLSSSKFFYTSGRNEFRNKGVDLYIKSLSKLNQKLKEENSNQIIVNFFLIPVGNFETNQTILKSIKGEDIKEDLMGIAPLSTHNVNSDNQIVKAFIESNLLNRKEDRVKVIMIPSYLNGQDGFLNTQYYDTILGFDLSIFPSFYEPWGYTPLESIAYSVPTVTSDLAGFGKAVLEDFNQNSCVKVLSRSKENLDESVQDLYDYFYNFINKNENEYKYQKEDAVKLSKEFSWEKFSLNYFKAYEFAINRR